VLVVIYHGGLLTESDVQVYHKWLQNHGETKNSKPPITIGRRWTFRSVVESLRKKELLKKIEDETGVKAGEHGMMNHYSKYLTEMVESLTEKEIEEATEMAVGAVAPDGNDGMEVRCVVLLFVYVCSLMFSSAMTKPSNHRRSPLLQPSC
jgi:hypothetical protein